MSDSRAASRPPSVLPRLRNRIVLVLLREEVRGQGQHIDPDEIDPASPPKVQRTLAAWRALRSPNMAVFVDALRPPDGGSVRDGVIGDLAGYHQLEPEQVIERCLHWEA